MSSNTTPPDDLLHWEDFPTGTVLTSHTTTVDHDAVIDFAREFDPQPFHLSEETAQGSVFGRLCASGWHTAAAWMKCG